MRTARCACDADGAAPPSCSTMLFYFPTILFLPVFGVRHAGVVFGVLALLGLGIGAAVYLGQTVYLFLWRLGR